MEEMTAHASTLMYGNYMTILSKLLSDISNH